MLKRSRNRLNGRPNQKTTNYEIYDNRMKANAQQNFDKYNHLGRDMLTSGDRISAESYFQHAEHYLRILNEIKAHNAKQAEQNQTQNQKQHHNPTQKEPSQTITISNDVEENVEDNGENITDAPSVQINETQPAPDNKKKTRKFPRRKPNSKDPQSNVTTEQGQISPEKADS